MRHLLSAETIDSTLITPPPVQKTQNNKKTVKISNSGNSERYNLAQRNNKISNGFLIGNLKFNNPPPKLGWRELSREHSEFTCMTFTLTLHYIWKYISSEFCIWYTINSSTSSRQIWTYDMKKYHSFKLSVWWDPKPVFKSATANRLNNRSQIWLRQQWDIKVLQPCLQAPETRLTGLLP